MGPSRGRRTKMQSYIRSAQWDENRGQVSRSVYYTYCVSMGEKKQASSQLWSSTSTKGTHDILAIEDQLPNHILDIFHHLPTHVATSDHKCV